MKEQLERLNKLAELVDLDIFYDIDLNEISSFRLMSEVRFKEALEKIGYKFTPYEGEQGWLISKPNEAQPVPCRITLT